MLKSLLEYRNATMHSQFENESQSQSQAHSNTNALTATTQRNLQLFVITHDKRLVDHLYLACRPEYIYGLRKDENGNSIVRAHNRIYDSNEFEDGSDDGSMLHA